MAVRDVPAGRRRRSGLSYLFWSLVGYQQTFTDPLNLFTRPVLNRFVTRSPQLTLLRIALPFFPLLRWPRPLTVHAVSLFSRFAPRYAVSPCPTLTDRPRGVGSGHHLAFVPFRFGCCRPSPTFFPLDTAPLRALVLFARERSWTRGWLGVAFFMTGLTTISWLTLSLVPFVVSAAILLTRYGIWRDWVFWRRGAVALGLASVALLPFLLPYSAVAELYNFRRSINEVKGESAQLHHCCHHNRNRLWRGLGDHLPLGRIFVFHVAAHLLPLAAWFMAVVRVDPSKKTDGMPEAAPARTRWIWALDALAIFALIISVPAFGTARNGLLHTVYSQITSERVLAFLVAVVIARFCLAYPVVLRFHMQPLETLRPAAHRRLLLGLF